MNIMVIGGGGREHAVIKTLNKNPEIKTIYALPGNGGIAADAVCVPVGAKDVDGMVRFAQENRVDFAVVTPDDPLVLGAADALEAAGVPCGPINNLDQVFQNPQVQARGLRVDIPREDTGPIPLVGSPIKFSATPIRYELPPPRLGEHTDSVLRELLGYTAEQIAAAVGPAGASASAD